jgi:hypothetical protein
MIGSCTDRQWADANPRLCRWSFHLLVYRGSDWFLAEVKASGDGLSEDQKRWIQDNHRYLHLPFKLVKIHKQEIINAAPRHNSSSGTDRRRNRLGCDG